MSRVETWMYGAIMPFLSFSRLDTVDLNTYTFSLVLAVEKLSVNTFASFHYRTEEKDRNGDLNAQS
jgi:hypothetical protein